MSVNLYQNMGQAQDPMVRPPRKGRSLAPAFLIILLPVVGYAGLWYFNTSVLVNQKQNLETELAQLKKDLTRDDADLVYDASLRIAEAQKESTTKMMSVSDELGRIEKLMLPGVRLTSFQYANSDGRKIVLEGEANSMDLLAKQLIRLREGSGGYAELSVDELGVNDQGKDTFTFHIPLKN